MTALERIPARPLRAAAIRKLNADDRLLAVPYGGVPNEGEVRIYALKLATDRSAYALGFDDARGQWRRLATVETADLAAADGELDRVLDEWATDTYGGRFEVRKPV